jgi:hypothetical protein
MGAHRRKGPDDVEKILLLGVGIVVMAAVLWLMCDALVLSKMFI